MAPHENGFFDVVLDQSFDGFGAHPERVNRETVSEFRVTGNFADDEFRPAFRY
jgi:hypothetical protein